MDKKYTIDQDFVHLARVALSGRTQDVQALLRRVAKRQRPGLPQLADDLAALLQNSPTRASPLRRQTEIPIPVDMESRLHLLRVEEFPRLELEPIFRGSIARTLHQLVDERRRPEALLLAGLEPSRTALFTGPPGVGKTLAARWLARELQRPLLILDLAAVMSSLLGRTGSNLRHVLEYAKNIDCVLLLDELDAIAKRRDDRGEIGELKRLVTVLIQQIDDWPSSNLLLAATNHPDLLDPAIWRRFEVNVAFPLPDMPTIADFIETSLAPTLSTSRIWGQALSIAFEGRSFSDIERDLMTARRASALAGTPLEDHLASLFHANELPKAKKIALAIKLVDAGIVSQRKAQELTGVSRDTIRCKTGKNKKSSETNTEEAQ